MPKISIAIPCIEETELMKKNIDLLSKDNRILEVILEKGTSPIGKAHQNLLEKCKGDMILFLHSDVELLDNPIDKLLSLLKGDVVGASCATIELDSTYYTNEVVRRLLPDVFPKKRSHFNCGLFNRKALLDIGGFNAELMSAEDNDIQIRLNKKKLDIVGVKDAVVKHHSTRDFKKELSYFQGYKYLMNKYGFFEAEADLVDLSSLKSYLIRWQVDKKECFKDLKKGIKRKIKQRIQLPKLIIENFVRGYLPESLKPFECGFLITENCFFKCKSCTYWHEKKQDLSKEKVFEIIDKLAEFGLKQITLLGGEPTSRDDFGDIIDHVKSKGIKCGVITNGALGKAKLKELLKLDYINISIDGMRDTHNFLRGVNTWDASVDLMFTLKNQYNKDVVVSFVVQQGNYKELRTMTEFFNRQGILNYILCYSSGGMGQPSFKPNYQNELQYVLDNIKQYNFREEQIEYLNLVKTKFNPLLAEQKCIAPNIKLMIDGKGNVYPCSAWQSPVGNIFEHKNFQDLWQSYSNLRQVIRSGQHKRCAECTSCELIPNFVYGHNFNKKVFKHLIAKFI